jgi:hypothetical protein
MAFYPVGGVNAYIRFRDAGAVQVDVRMNPNGTLSIYRDIWTLLETSTQQLTVGTWHWLQIRVKIANTGAYRVIVDGVTWLTSDNADTMETANASASEVFMSFYSGMGADDMIIRNGSGSSDADFFGECKVTTLYPSGGGSNAEWDPSADSNFQCVDEAQSDGDTTYVSTNIGGEKDSYAFDNLTGSPTVKAVAVSLVARKDDAGTQTVNTLVRHGGTDYFGATTHSLTSSHLQYRENYDTNPGTSLAWEVSDVNAAEFGVRRIVQSSASPSASPSISPSISPSPS